MKNKIKQIFKILLGSIFVFFITFVFYILYLYVDYSYFNKREIEITKTNIKKELNEIFYQNATSNSLLVKKQKQEQKTINSLNNNNNNNINIYYSYINEMSNDISLLKQVLKELKIDNKNLNEKIFTFEKVFESMSKDLKTHNFNRLDLVALDYLFFKKDAFAIISAKYEGLKK